mgnify:CR=1 FL=1
MTLNPFSSAGEIAAAIRARRARNASAMETHGESESPATGPPEAGRCAQAKRLERDIPAATNQWVFGKACG